MSPIPSTGNAVDVYRLPDYDLIATPVAPFGVTLQPQKNGPGTGGFSIPLDDPAYEDIQVNDVVALRRDGETVLSFIVEEINEHTLDANEGASKTATYLGRGVGAFLEWTLVFPQLGDEQLPIEEDSVWDWRSPLYDMANDDWNASNEIMTVTAAKAGGWPTTPMGQDFDDSLGAYMIWDASGDDDSAPEGWCLFIRDVTITEAGRWGLETLMDNDGFVYVDGQQQVQIRQTEGYHRASFVRIEFSTGDHRLTFATRNFDGPAALAFNLYKTDHQDHPLPGGPTPVVSDDVTQVLSYPDPFPGMTVGDDWQHLLAAADDLNTVSWLVPSFDETEDSDGETWERPSITTKTGTTTGLQFLGELVAAGHVAQWRVRNDGVTFDLFAPGYSNRPTFSAPYTAGYEIEPAPVDDPRTGQLVQLDRRVT